MGVTRPRRKRFSDYLPCSETLHLTATPAAYTRRFNPHAFVQSFGAMRGTSLCVSSVQAKRERVGHMRCIDFDHSLFHPVSKTRYGHQRCAFLDGAPPRRSETSHRPFELVTSPPNTAYLKESGLNSVVRKMYAFLVGALVRIFVA
jgi:hypothetical protein